MRYFRLISVLLLVVKSVCGEKNEQHVKEKWINLGKSTQRLINVGIRLVKPFLHSFSLNVSPICTRDFDRFLNGIGDFEPWALSMLDASAKPIDGIAKGSFTSLGSYDQCVNLKVLSSNTTKVSFTGQYCMLMAKPPLPSKPEKYRLDEPLLEFSNASASDNFVGKAGKIAQIFYYVSLRYGVCIPSSCNRKDVYSLFKKVSSLANLEIIVPSCEIKQKTSIQTFQIFPLICLGSLLLLCIVGTITHWLSQKKSNTDQRIAVNILQEFSLPLNAKKILETAKSAESLGILHGMRFLTLSWIVLGHTYSNTNFDMVHSMLELIKFPDSFAFTPIANGTLSVDSFFFISGLLVSYTIMKKTEKSGTSINIPLYLFHRLWRLTPTLMVVIGLVCFLPWMGSGPIWHELIDKEVDGCRTNWWTNLLYVNNFVGQDNPCVEHSWFLACDMQFYVVALLVMLMILRCPIAGLLIAGLLIMLSIFITGYITYVNDYTPTILVVASDPELRKSINHNLYFKPYPHAGAYFVGTITGYFVSKQYVIKMSKITQIFGWTVATAWAMLIVYAVYDWNKGFLPGILVTVLYAATHRTAWALALSWLTIACFTGNGEWIRKLLSWKGMIPLSRCTFVAYLIHIYVQKHYIARSRVTLYADHQVYVWQFFGNLIISYGLAFVGAVLFEFPLRSMEKYILTPLKKTSSFTLPQPNEKYVSNGKYVEGEKKNGTDNLTRISPS